LTREEGLKQIDEAQWEKDEIGCLNLYVNDKDGRPVHAWLTMRPPYCDRGHVNMNIEAPSLFLDGQDSFPRYFFSFEEADVHTRTFLKWRLWKERTHSHAEVQARFLQA
jgi:hypothetical protein